MLVCLKKKQQMQSDLKHFQSALKHRFFICPSVGTRKRVADDDDDEKLSWQESRIIWSYFHASLTRVLT